ncbi:hypothetical protein N9R79_09805 [Vibrio sp.]|nr:hypothetical protein [Vibrio sp.]
MSIEQIRELRAELKAVTDKFDQPFDSACLLAQLDVSEHFMSETNDKFGWKAYGRGTVRFITNDLRYSLIKSKWCDGSDFYDAPLFYGWSLKQIEERFISDDADSIPACVLIAYSHYQVHEELVQNN